MCCIYCLGAGRSSPRTARPDPDPDPDPTNANGGRRAMVERGKKSRGRAQPRYEQGTYSFSHHIPTATATEYETVYHVYVRAECVLFRRGDRR